MADDKIEHEDQGAGAGEDVSFSDAQQEKINEIISKRLAERDAKHAKDLETLNAKHKRDLEMSKLDEESRLKAEMEDQLKQSTQRAEAAEHKLRIASAERELAKAGLDTSLAETIMGEDDDAMKANIEALSKTAKAMADRMYAERVGASGAPKAPEGSDGSSGLEARMRTAAGLPPVKGGS